jgi:hypothetical protein
LGVSEVVEPAIGQGDLYAVSYFQAVQVLAHDTSGNGFRLAIDLDQELEGVSLDVCAGNGSVLPGDGLAVDDSSK